MNGSIPAMKVIAAPDRLRKLDCDYRPIRLNRSGANAGKLRPHAVQSSHPMGADRVPCGGPVTVVWTDEPSTRRLPPEFLIIAKVENFFTKGCGRCYRFAKPDCYTQPWAKGLVDLCRTCQGAGLAKALK